MAGAEIDAHKPRRRLVGQPLLYSISVFASLGVFLVRNGDMKVARCILFKCLSLSVWL
jgi:hypothetical protein